MKALGKKKAGKGQTGNVMTPLNWMCGVSQALFLGSSAVVPDSLSVPCFVVAVSVMVFYGAMYVYFSLRDPDRLQSEAYNITFEEMRLQVGDSSRETIALQAHQNQVEIVQAVPSKDYI